MLEASAKSCGSEFHAEVGKFKFLNEMIKLVSPKYLGPRTPEHVKKKVMLSKISCNSGPNSDSRYGRLHMWRN